MLDLADYELLLAQAIQKRGEPVHRFRAIGSDHSGVMGDFHQPAFG
jgi:hypothetical protein